jgi:hypothetical protein
MYIQYVTYRYNHTHIYIYYSNILHPNLTTTSSSNFDPPPAFQAFFVLEMILRIVVATPRRFFKGDMSRVPSEGQWPFQETKLVLSSYHIYKTYVRPMQGLCKGIIPLILCWMVHFRKLSYSLHEAFLSTGRFWWLPGSQFMLWVERNANDNAHAHTHIYIYAYTIII